MAKKKKGISPIHIKLMARAKEIEEDTSKITREEFREFLVELIELGLLSVRGYKIRTLNYAYPAIHKYISEQCDPSPVIRNYRTLVGSRGNIRYEYPPEIRIG